MTFYASSGGLSATGKFPILYSMDAKELERRVRALDKRRGQNLLRLRIRSGLSQDKLFQKTGIGQGKISAYENGQGFDKETLVRLCEALDAKEWEFDLDKETPVVQDETEQQDLFRRREARETGVAEDTAKYETFRIKEAKKNASSGSEGKEVGIPRRSRKRA